MENKKSTEAKGDTIMNKEDFAALWKSIRLKVTDTYDVPPEILWVNGSTIGTLGNFSASTGKAKSKKTFNISAIVAAALTNDEVLHYSACLPPDKRKILYVDTEQSRYHCHKVMERILRLAGLPTDQDRDDFVFIVLREQTPDMRKRIIEYMLTGTTLFSSYFGNRPLTCGSGLSSICWRTCPMWGCSSLTASAT